MLRFASIALLLLTPVAAAAETLDSLEEPRSGSDKIWEVTVLQNEGGKPRALIYRNSPSQPFGLVVYDSQGNEVYAKNGTRGIQTLPALTPGEYRFFVRGTGAFQATGQAFERNNLTGADTKITGAADAYVHSPTKFYEVSFAGDVEVEWWDITMAPETFRAPGNRTASVGHAYVTTIRGAEGTPYTITLTTTEAPPTANDTPFVGALGIVLLSVTAVLLRRRHA